MTDSTTGILALIKDLIEGGFIGQAVLGTLVWGAIAYLSITHTQVDDRLWSAGLVILGYFFHMVQAASASKAKAECAKSISAVSLNASDE